MRSMNNEQKFALDSTVFHWDLFCGWVECSVEDYDPSTDRYMLIDDSGLTFESDASFVFPEENNSLIPELHIKELDEPISQ